LLSNPINVSISNGSGIVTIIDNDGGLTITSDGGTESCDDFVEFIVSGASNTYLTLQLVNQTATGSGVDFGSSTSTNLQVFNGSTWENYSNYIVIPAAGYILVRTSLVDDATNESTESFQLKATPVSAAIASFPIYDVNFQTINLSGWSLLSGTDEQVNAVYRKTNAITIAGQAIDVRATITGRSNVGSSASNFVFDDDGSNSSRFQPEINSTSASGSYVDFSFKFYLSGTNTQVALENFYVTGVDVDGSSASATEFIELENISSYTVDNGCLLTITPEFRPGFTRFYGIPSSLSSISFENTASFVANYFDPVANLNLRAGYSSNVSSARLFSIAFGSSIGSFSSPSVTEDEDIAIGTANILNKPSEICNNVDDDCDGSVDEGIATVTYYLDEDGDGFGSTTSTQACSAPSGYVTNNNDCNDGNASLHTITAEVCNGLDDDCDGSTDEGVLNTYYADVDGDGFGSTTSILACSTPTGYVANNTDCNDSNASLHTITTEVCNGVDDDCDGSTDEGVLNTYYLDSDGDGFGSTTITQACSAPTGYVTNNTDCNDTNASLHTITTEVCNGLDDDCDGSTDEGVLNTYYLDSDGDGFGSTTSTQACSAPTGYVTNNTDCNDTNASLHTITTEVCNGVDDDCDGSTDEGVLNTYYLDSDGDGFGSTSTTQACSAPSGYVSNDDDCDDADGNVNPSAVELCNYMDDNCNELTDEGVTTTYYLDSDADGFGNAENSIEECGLLIGYSENSDDCDDTNPLVNGNAAEACDNIDNDCDEEIDEFVTNTYFTDADGDGFGDTNESTQACSTPDGYVDNADDCDDNLLTFEDADGDGFGTEAMDACGADNELDCDDTNPSINAGASDICGNGVDEDCMSGDSVCVVFGCLDVTACNFNPSATDDDASCTYPLQTYLNCDGSCINDSDNDGVCNELEAAGCTDPDACNYNATATDDDASCTYPLQTYLNCDGSCINDTDNDGVCNENEIPGCTDELACNYNATATDDDASCTYPLQTYLNCDGSCMNDADNDGVCNENEVPGCTDELACNYNATATDDDASCTYPLQTYLNCDGSCMNDADNDGVCNENEVPGCTDELACNYNATATDDDASCTYPSQTYLNCDGSCINDADNDGVCNENEVPGCTDPLACNYNSNATDDDASCTYPLQTYLNCDGSCINDADNDGV
jgi:hypothetical protein